MWPGPTGRSPVSLLVDVVALGALVDVTDDATQDVAGSHYQEVEERGVCWSHNKVVACLVSAGGPVPTNQV